MLSSIRSPRKQWPETGLRSLAPVQAQLRHSTPMTDLRELVAEILRDFLYLDSDAARARTLLGNSSSLSARRVCGG
jgi:hypothetical protein